MIFFVCLLVKVSVIFAQENLEVISGLCYQLDANTKQAVVMPNEDERYSGDIVIPEKVTAKDGKDYSVVGLGDECFKHSYVQTVKIPNSVKYLGNSCFEFSDIEQILIPSSVVSIGDECFNGCGYLVDVSLPNSVVSLGKRCFGSCEKIQAINLPSSITTLGENCFSFCSKLTNIEIPSSVKTIGDYCFSYAKNLVEVDMPSSVTNIGHNCFNGCENLESIFFRGTMPDGINDMSIPKVCMLYVPESEEQNYKNSLRSLYSYIYPWNPTETKKSVSVWLETINGLRYLVDSKNDIVKLVAGKPYSYAGKIEVPCNIVSKDGKSRDVVAFDDFSLSGFYGLLGVTVPETVKYLGNSCFANSYQLQEVKLPESLQSFGENCFYGCSALTSVNIPSSVNSLSKGCFEFCSSLIKIDIPSTVSVLEDNCFEFCSSLDNVRLPASLTSIGDDCFGSCSALSSIIIPPSMTMFGRWCFFSCDNLESILFKGKLPDNTSDCSAPETCVFLVPPTELNKYQKALKKTYQYIYAWNSDATDSENDVPVWLETIQGIRYLINKNTQSAAVMPSKTKEYSGDVVILSEVTARDGKKYTVTALNDACFLGCNYLTSVMIPSTVTSIGDGSFNSCFNLTSIDIPLSVTHLGNYCFIYSGLKKIVLPSSIISLGDNCFVGCTNLEEVELPSSLESIGESCFYLCSKLRKIQIPTSITSLPESCFLCCTNLKNIVIPSSVKSLGNSCFGFCKNLESIELPNSLNSIGPGCFSTCESLETIIIPSSVSLVDAGCFYGCESLESIYFKGKLPDMLYYMNAPTEVNVYVPRPCLQAYINAIGTKFPNIFPWDGGDIVDNIVCINANDVNISAENGTVKLYGLSNGQLVDFYAPDGRLIDSTKVANSTVSCAFTGQFVIVKINGNAIKIALK